MLFTAISISHNENVALPFTEKTGAYHGMVVDRKAGSILPVHEKIRYVVVIVETWSRSSNMDTLNVSARHSFSLHGVSYISELGEKSRRHIVYGN